MSLDSKVKTKLFFFFLASSCSVVGSLYLRWSSHFEVSSLWFGQRLRNLIPILKTLAHTDCFHGHKKKSFWLKINGQFQMGPSCLGVECIPGCVGVSTKCYQATHWQRRLLYWLHAQFSGARRWQASGCNNRWIESCHTAWWHTRSNLSQELLPA